MHEQDQLLSSQQQLIDLCFRNNNIRKFNQLSLQLFQPSHHSKDQKKITFGPKVDNKQPEEFFKEIGYQTACSRDQQKNALLKCPVGS